MDTGLIVWTLPCRHERHRSCAGRVTLGIEARRGQYACGCPCHIVTSAPLQPVG